MSSAPAGLDAREYAYACFRYTTPDGVNHELTTRNDWLVTRIQVYGPPSGSVFVTPSGSSSIEVLADGCLTLEPNGAHRGPIVFGGAADALIIVEFWFQARTDGNFPVVTVTP